MSNDTMQGGMGQGQKEGTQRPAGGGPVGGPMGGRGGGPGGALGRPVEKAKDFKGSLKRLSFYLAPQKMRFFIVGILAVVSTVFSIFGPKVLGKATTKIADGVIAKYVYLAKIQAAINQNAPASVVDHLRQEPILLFDFGYIGKIIILMIVLYFISFLCSYAMSYVMAGVSQRTV
ncbi:MAG: transporter ATP-binding protein [Bacillota bacterium]|nr:transporter ATP-binding protein [Bacillota bacterium]